MAGKYRSPFGADSDSENQRISGESWNAGYEEPSKREITELLEKEEVWHRKWMIALRNCLIAVCIAAGTVAVILSFYMKNRGGFMLGTALTAFGILGLALHQGWVGEYRAGLFFAISGILLEALGLYLGEGIAPEGIALTLVGIMLVADAKERIPEPIVPFMGMLSGMALMIVGCFVCWNSRLILAGLVVFGTYFFTGACSGQMKDT